MTNSNEVQFLSAVFLTFSGNCKEALTFYQTCFGGELKFDLFEKRIPGSTILPVVNGSLIADRIIIHGSDLVHEEGRIHGNYMAIFMHCPSTIARRNLIKKLQFNQPDFHSRNDSGDRLIEIVDTYDVRWVLQI